MKGENSKIMKSLILIAFLFISFLVTDLYAQIKTYVINQKNYIHALDFSKEFNMKFDWNNDLVYLFLKTIIKKTSSNIERIKDKLRRYLNSD